MRMNTSDDQDSPSRRSFLLSTGGLLTSAWLVTHWSAVAAAAHHADEMAAAPTPVGFQFFSPSEAADVGAIAAQIVPSGVTPGAGEAHAVYFTDRALSTFFAGWAADYRAGLMEFQSKFHAANPAAASFAAASSDEQIAFLKTVDHTAFFETERTLTLLGMFTSPKYGGNYEGSGWKLMGFEDRHIFAPPFGYYDAEYTGFVPYTDEQS
jgi:gluconate 2-dehydrogenase gamma chain